MTLIEPIDLAALPSPADLGPVHFIAVGGSGMSGIAQAFADLGVPVSGSDRTDSATLRGLRGIRTHVGHDAAQLGDARTVVVSTAIRDDNPELVEARRRGLRVLHRSAALGALMRGRPSIAVGGTHGKTTTSAMIVAGLLGAGVRPGYVTGAPLAATGVSADLGDPGAPFVAEADESDASFLQLPRDIAVVTNVEADHLDNWGDPAAYVAGFDAFAAPARVLIAGADDPGAAALAGRARAAGGPRVIGYGDAPGAEFATVRLELAVPGAHNRANATAAAAVLGELGLGDRLAGLEAFSGTARRFQSAGEAGGIRVVDDYAHHPTEVAATLAAARETGPRKVIAVFQPHLYSRTRDQAAGFAEALAGADHVLLLDIYPAREEPIPGVTSALIGERLPGSELVSRAAVAARIRELAGPGDLVLTLGAGDVTELAAPIVAELRR
ncbi:UDP-N-acetylmuramate--alanine ligase [Naumannella cuiyingiana]|uniref:UDP-N-acetylmuramate--L-alanine ligase n=1 Tax=Naumannella cuiyingiana TaxID=1347891 RepID=A0A7Z0DAP3_9ACTN|nr:UDP-N-acetylmuramate--L-alanine ligase [Naumannella cuiyingiana]NYI72100.1 UDP-N-acetylmuramate--alanine ligase [Naumannella cuiyingiana]